MKIVCVWSFPLIAESIVVLHFFHLLCLSDNFLFMLFLKFIILKSTQRESLVYSSISHKTYNSIWVSHVSDSDPSMWVNLKQSSQDFGLPKLVADIARGNLTHCATTLFLLQWIICFYLYFFFLSLMQHLSLFFLLLLLCHYYILKENVRQFYEQKYSTVSQWPTQMFLPTLMKGSPGADAVV